MKKKVCHITSAHTRYDIRIFAKECKSLAKMGYEVILLVNDQKNDEICEAVSIISTQKNPKSRLDRFFTTRKTLLKKAKEIDAEIYHLHDPDLLYVGNKLKKIGKKVIFDSHEDVPTDILGKEWLPITFRKFISKIYENYEKKSLKLYDGVITVSPHIASRLKLINDNTEMITNYPIVNNEEVIKRNPQNNICFAGIVGKDWSHHVLLDALENLDIEYILAGRGTDNYFNQLKNNPSWKKVDYRGIIPHSEVKSIYEKSIAGVALHNTIWLQPYGTLGNTKLFEFMESKLPVICTNYSLWKEIVEKYECGICIDSADKNAITNAINYLVENPSIAEKMGENGRKAVLEVFNWERQSQLLETFYSQL